MLKLVKSPFYTEPEFDETDAPAKQPSRAIDIFVGGPGLVTYNHVTLKTATQFKRVLDRPLLNNTSTVVLNLSYLALAAVLTEADTELQRPFIP